MLKLKTFLRETNLSDSTYLGLFVEGFSDEEFHFASDVGVPMKDAKTGEDLVMRLTPVFLKYGNTETTERLMNMRVLFCSVKDDCLEILLGK